MNGAVHAGDVRGMGHGALHAPPQLLAFCLAASLALHALIFLLLPDWHRDAVVPPTPVLDVVMVSREPEAPVAQQPRPQPEIPGRVTSRPQPAVREAAAVSTPEPIALAPGPAAPNFTVPVEPPRAAEAKPAPAPRADPVTPPAFSAAYLRNPSPRYPPAARRNGDEGTVMLKVLVSAEGVPLRVELDQSSGSNPLDGAALDAVKGWRFVPARRGMQTVEAWVRVPIVFRLEP